MFKMLTEDDTVQYVMCLKNKNFAKIADALGHVAQHGNARDVYDLCSVLERSVGVVKLGIKSPIQKITMDGYQVHLMNICKIACLAGRDLGTVPATARLKDMLEELASVLESHQALCESMAEFGYAEEDLDKELEDSGAVLKP